MNLTIKDFKKHYNNKTISISNCTFNERVTILFGENGCGKTTLLKAIFGLINYSGDIECRYSSGLFLDNSFSVKNIDVEAYVDLYLKTFDYNTRRFTYLYDLFSIEKIQHQSIETLSKGEHQKLLITLILSLEKELFLLDEPFNGLDHQSSKKLIDFIVHDDCKYIITTHIEDEDVLSSFKVILYDDII